MWTRDSSTYREVTAAVARYINTFEHAKEAVGVYLLLLVTGMAIALESRDLMLYALGIGLCSSDAWLRPRKLRLHGMRHHNKSVFHSRERSADDDDQYMLDARHNSMIFATEAKQHFVIRHWGPVIIVQAQLTFFTFFAILKLDLYLDHGNHAVAVLALAYAIVSFVLVMWRLFRGFHVIPFVAECYCSYTQYKDNMDHDLDRAQNTDLVPLYCLSARTLISAWTHGVDWLAADYFGAIDCGDVARSAVLRCAYVLAAPSTIEPTVHTPSAVHVASV